MSYDNMLVVTNKNIITLFPKQSKHHNNNNKSMLDICLSSKHKVSPSSIQQNIKQWTNNL